MSKPYKHVRDGEWVTPHRRGNSIACCDCGLVHTMDFRLVKDRRGHTIQLRVVRNKRATAAMRRKQI
jgi:hypothetical protein